MKILEFLKCTKGATAIEYGLIASGVALVIVVAVYAFGDELAVMFASLNAIL